MIKKRLGVLAGIAAATFALLPGTLMVSVASADTLSNGLSVTCNQDTDIHATCIVGGCARVDGDYVIKTLHYKINGGEQEETGMDCINGQTVRVGADNNGQPLSIGVQGCRKNFGPVSDDCTPYASYTFTPPQKAAPPPVEEKKPEPPAVVQPVPCPAGSTTASVIPPATCEAIPLPDPNSVTMTASGSGGKVNVSFKNSSNVLATCEYTAAPASNPLGILPTINKTVKVQAKGSGALNGEPGPPPLVTYNLSANCTGIFNGSEVPLGNPTTSVSG